LQEFGGKVLAAFFQIGVYRGGCGGCARGSASGLRQGELLKKELAPAPIQRSREATFAFPWRHLPAANSPNSAQPSYNPSKLLGQGCFVGVCLWIEVGVAEIGSKEFFSFMGLRKRDFSATVGCESGEADPVEQGGIHFTALKCPHVLSRREPPRPRRGRPPRFLGG